MKVSCNTINVFFLSTRFIFQGRKLLGEIAVDILACLNVKDLHMAEDVSDEWRETVLNGRLWEKLFKRNASLAELPFVHIRELCN